MADDDADKPLRSELIPADSFLAPHEVAGRVRSIYVVPNVLRAEDERLLHHQLLDVPRTRWTTLSGRRVQSWGGAVHERGMVPTPMPGYLTALCDMLAADGPLPVFAADKRPNHVLVNEYAPGQGIDAHQDGPLYLPLVAIVSLGAPVVMDFFAKEQDGEMRRWIQGVFLPPRSLLVFCDDAYDACLHCIEHRPADPLSPDSIVNYETAQAWCAEQLGVSPVPLLPRGTRYSVTIRRVLKVLSGIRIKL